MGVSDYTTWGILSLDVAFPASLEDSFETELKSELIIENQNRYARDFDLTVNQDLNESLDIRQIAVLITTSIGREYPKR